MRDSACIGDMGYSNNNTNERTSSGVMAGNDASPSSVASDFLAGLAVAVVEDPGAGLLTADLGLESAGFDVSDEVDEGSCKYIGT